MLNEMRPMAEEIPITGKSQFKKPQFVFLNPKKPGGLGGIHPLGTDKACIPSIFIKTFQFFFGEN